MYRVALDGYEKTPEKDQVQTKECAKNLANMFREQGRQDELQNVLANYP